MRARPLATALALACAAGCRRSAAPPEGPAPFGFGRPAEAAEIRAWDISVAPDGRGLPAGSGTAGQGAPIYAGKCARCHGATGTEGPFDTLVGREPRDFTAFGREGTLSPTIGNYWPYATTIYDYLNRAMPLDHPGSLTPDEIYALTAWLLWRNEIIPETAVINARTLPRVVMPAYGHFVPDDRRGGREVR